MSFICLSVELSPDREISTLPDKFSKSPDAFFLLVRTIAKTFCVFSARMGHYENIFETFFLPARTFTKTFLKRCFCLHGPAKDIL